MEININSRSESEESPKHYECESCKNLCNEAKDTVKAQDKKIYKMTIALAVAMTLLGQEAADKAVSLFNSVTSITDKVDGSHAEEKKEDHAPTDSKESDNKEEDHKADFDSIHISIPTNTFKSSSLKAPSFSPMEPATLIPPVSTTPLLGMPYRGFTPIPWPSNTSNLLPSAVFSTSPLFVPRSDIPPLSERGLPAKPNTIDTVVCYSNIPSPTVLTTFVAGIWMTQRNRA